MLASEAVDSFFRVAVNGGGCSGFQYEFSIDTHRQDNDMTFTSHGVEVVIDEMSLELVDNAELDYVQDLIGSYFAVTNPNAIASCGCGTFLYNVMRIAGRNVNSAKARLDHIKDWLAADSADVLLLQEIKSQTENFPRDLFVDKVGMSCPWPKKLQWRCYH